MEPRNPLHIYRALLRATSYLPDAAARAYLADHIRTRFVTHAKSTPLAHIAKNRLKTAEKTARCLERAGRGNIEDLEKVLDFAYGRKGARRRHLLRDLLQKDPPQDDRALAELIKAGSDQAGKKQPPEIEQMEPTPKFRAFLKSHVQCFPKNTQVGKPKIRSTAPRIPETNTWGRPMPLRRQRSIRKRWWAETLDRMFPPVPLKEWNRLRDLALGVVPVEPLIPRRKPQKPRKIDPEEAIQQQNRRVVKYLMDTARAKGTMSFDPDRGLVVDEEGNAGDESESTFRVYNYQRTMRRLYSRLWGATPTMYHDVSLGDWVVHWGKPASPFHSGMPSILPKEKKVLYSGTEDLPLKDSDQSRKTQKGKKSDSISTIEGSTSNLQPGI
ncbi:uncharacterized protein BP5553_10155 [Venustampulla echinocandica]|uniref:LYR motif-containing protein Cup1-like N-terminal domain-containing protein n=1 Tax=Venustampulla echinocandica TaxID=2656787 RepID=A0A370TAJ4_9HELO|nr:uncharacterized protein BP5553_10155 [Venustampulla echinocandica]RDL30810.1 hypothetical protein BP5553_10155 [Venustampulla echinocandica]